MFEILLGR